MKKMVGVALALCMALASAGCGEPSADPAAGEVELVVAAAASLTDVMPVIAAAYSKTAPHVTLTFTFAGSGTLQEQIKQGAPVDLFIAAAPKHMDALKAHALLWNGSFVNLLENKVVMIVPADSALGLGGFADLAKDTVKVVAIGDPASVPAGQYAEEVLSSLGIRDEVWGKANLGTDVRQVLTWVEVGEADAGIVYATDAAAADNVTVVCEAPAGSVPPVYYPAAVISTSAHAGEAQAFLDFLKSDVCGTLFEDYGFITAD